MGRGEAWEDRLHGVLWDPSAPPDQLSERGGRGCFPVQALEGKAQLHSTPGLKLLLAGRLALHESPGATRCCSSVLLSGQGE